MYTTREIIIYGLALGVGFGLPFYAYTLYTLEKAKKILKGIGNNFATIEKNLQEVSKDFREIGNEFNGFNKELTDIVKEHKNSDELIETNGNI
ncbi:MAG: hypothetical protein NTY99_02860 [DPANN group archaeon]|nr:hypothetical protein [DPANN group archaeon]